MEVNQIQIEQELECIPTFPEYSYEELKQLQNSDETLSIVAKFIAENKKPERQILQKQPKDVKKLLRDGKFDSLCLINGVIYRSIDDPEIGECKQLLVPDSLKSNVLDIMHNKSGHQATERTYALMKKQCYCLHMLNDIKVWIQKCERCLLSKSPLLQVRATLESLTAKKPLQILAIDFTLLEKSSNGRENDRCVFSSYNNERSACYNSCKVVSQRMVPLFWNTKSSTQ